MKKYIKGFTLAETMIALIIIGILITIMIPVAMKSKPDQNYLKFKKANETLMQSVSTLVSADKYYLRGDLGLKPNGDYADKSYFCRNFADTLNTKKIACDYTIDDFDSDGFYYSCELSFAGEKLCTPSDMAEIKASLDTACKESQAHINGDVGVTTTDNVVYYEPTLENHFGCIVSDTCDYSSEHWGSEYNGKRLYNEDLDVVKMVNTGIQTNRIYRLMCIDVDGIPDDATESDCKNECPFGYGIRVDGKILVGARAQEWIEKIQTSSDNN